VGILLQLAGLALLTVAASMVDGAFGVATAGVSVLIVGVMVEMDDGGAGDQQNDMEDD
jgi:hypothetical protein